MPPGSLNPDPFSDQNMPLPIRLYALQESIPPRRMCRSVVNFSRELNFSGDSRDDCCYHGLSNSVVVVYTGNCF